MKITCISHAALLIEVDGFKIVTDPWIVGSAYCEQWYLFPKPETDYAKYLMDVDYILISHGHEDHLHHDTLKEINKSAHIFFPYTWYEGAVGFFNELGFHKITEAVNERSYKLSKNVRITYLANNLDNIVVIESRDKIIVNINDALHSAPQGIISYFIEKIKRKWNKVDYLFSGYGGASYFPNTIKFKEKNDIEIGITREQFFLDNFCKIAKGINAAYSIPFASDFVLLDDDQRWINKVKFPKGEIKNYFNEYYADSSCTTQIMELYAGDIISEGKFVLNSSYHEKLKNNDRDELIEKEYQDEIIRKRNIKKITENELINIFEKIKVHVNRKSYIVPPEERKELKFAIKITDASDNLFIQIDLTGNENKTELVPDFSPDNILLLKIKSKTILHSINNEWGGDAIIIGYGG
ncbi:MAG: MBL fold metallo-hydrolase, partial [Bacteroidota bacterium]